MIISKSTFRLLTAILIVVFAFPAGYAQSGDMVKQKQELERIKREMEESRNNLDSLQALEKKVQREISEYEQRTSINQTVLDRLNKQLKNIRSDLQRAKSNQDDAQFRLSASRDRYISNLKFYYTGIRWDQFETAGQVSAEKDALLRVLYLRAVAAYDRRQVTRSSEYLRDAEKEYSALASRVKMVGDAQKKKKYENALVSSQMTKRERELLRVKRKKESEADRLLSLSEEAKQMEQLISRLEDARRRREESPRTTEFKFATGNFASYKGALLAPISGRITAGYGWKTDPVTKLKSFSPGIEIDGKVGAPIRAVADGVVAYVGALRGYGVFAIIEHEDGFYSTYAGLSRALVDKDQIVKRGESLGAAENGRVKFELRQGKDPLDPVEWIKLDNIK
ncbi:exported hypothetical protein [Candidatus Zixiibacteriota bacterium]|nr:exported hypothetical protein [candidate division Zixibacteria bacterium]